MNEFAGYAREVPMGWWAMLRFARDARPKPLMGEGDKPIVFPDELSATKAVLRHFVAYFNGNLVASREIVGGSIKDARRARAERLFQNDAQFYEITNDRR
ncbi:hypothetical protein IB238_09165 [Rhizobium sp. ARZ01]|uniref:hypothetical protein n=1 Tax=Rhizobium sp. ARZ01 TaxID=2769313 RepID=UPI00177CC2F3|nr:hypothetical protein [Rhizobium sp. ARZ01]MBD9372788.1 hypothetical protein [Rhizobium sp. ARZ01]